MQLQMCLPLETLTSIMKTGLSILVELKDPVNSTQMVNFLLLSLTLTVLLLWIYSFLLTLSSSSIG